MLLRFTKMHGLGNDFMVLDLISQHAHIQPKLARLTFEAVPPCVARLQTIGHQSRLVEPSGNLV